MVVGTVIVGSHSFETVVEGIIIINGRLAFALPIFASPGSQEDDGETGAQPFPVDIVGFHLASWVTISVT